MQDFRTKSVSLLRAALADPNAEFRDGQYEAIKLLVESRSQLLIVQRTGWGKSSVYFIATRLNRDLGRGPTLLISPLLALMRNQVEAATRLGVKAETLNSGNTDQWEAIRQSWINDEIDVLLISPERLGNEDFRNQFLTTGKSIGLLVVDEAHCISDWGHDFRPDYRRITRILQALPPNTPVLATTATANDRVVADVKAQLGDKLSVIRGALGRSGLKLQVLTFDSLSERMAWLADRLGMIPGTGIIYALTIRDCERLAEWLCSCGIDAAAYHGDLKEPVRVALENRLLVNSIKVVVATSALGMGFDKPDLAFVIHLQRPGSVVHYYQQVGRAGRNLVSAYGILLAGDDDREINDFFINNAFPPARHAEEVLAALEANEDGLSVPGLENVVNLRHAQIEKVLKVLNLEQPSPVTKVGSKWCLTAEPYTRNQTLIDELTTLRQVEQDRMIQYTRTSDCLMQFLTSELNDVASARCLECANCKREQLFPRDFKDDTGKRVVEFLRRTDLRIEPRRQWQLGSFREAYGWSGNISPALRAEEGRALCLWADAGWGRIVKSGKQDLGTFSDDLVTACADLLQSRWNPAPFPAWVTCVPSLGSPKLVSEFASKLAEKLGLPFDPVVRKILKNQPQKTMRNSQQQCRNLQNVFEIGDIKHLNEPVLLVDDIVDSRWTITVVAALLRQAGGGLVYPMALAEASPKIEG